MNTNLRLDDGATYLQFTGTDNYECQKIETAVLPIILDIIGSGLAFIYHQLLSLLKV